MTSSDEELRKMRAIIEAIRELLYWDFENDRWRGLEEDPGWVGLDELCAIDELFRKNGYGPGG